MIVDKKKFQLIKIDKLVKADWNYKLDDEKKRLKLLNQIKRNGQLENIIVRELDTGFFEVVNGNHRMDVFKDIEEVKEIMAFNLGKISLSDAKRIAVETNETKFESGEEQLSELLIELTNDYELPDLEETMPWSLDELLEMTSPDPDLEMIIDEDEIPEPKESRVKKGDLWVLGDHRLVCGDATSEDDLGVLMGKERADMVFTDPPYGIDIVNGTRVGTTSKIGFRTVGVKEKVKEGVYKKIIGDDKPFDPTFLLSLGKTVMIFGANNFASKLPDNSRWVVWDKKAERGADHNNFSDVELIWTNIDKKSCLIYRYLWSGLLREGGRDIELKERVHPTQKPVGLLVEILKDNSKQGNIILDPYGGSGSTLIGCELLNLRCFMMEIDTYYSEIIINRWETLTGEKAVKVE